MDRILLYEDKESAERASRDLYEIDCEGHGKRAAPLPERMFAVDENILSGQVGLHVPVGWWEKVPETHRLHVQVKNPLWIDDRWINGNPFFYIGSNPFSRGFGIGIHNPTEARKLLEGNLSPSLIEQVRGVGREYSRQSHLSIDKLIAEINADPSVADARISEVGPYHFEEVVAALLRSLGFDAYLTKRSGDGGKDIIAMFYEGGEQYIVLVECKKRQKGEVFGPAEVRAIYGQYCYEKKVNGAASSAMLVTSAGTFGPSAIQMQEKVDDLSLKDRHDLLEWMRQYGNIRGDLWVPKRFKELL